MDYTDLYNFQTSTGTIVPRDSAVLQGVQTKFQEIFGSDIDLSPETAVGRLIETYAVVVKSTLGITAQSANQFNVNEATGIYLDSIAQIYGLKRIAGTKTRINIKCTFDNNPAGTDTIPAGALIKSTATGAMFRIDSPIVNNGAAGGKQEEGGLYYAEGSATAVDTGPIVPPSGSVTSIQSAVMGWRSVVDVGNAYIGTDIESDEAFRQRIMLSRPVGIGFATHVVSALNRIDGVYSNCIIENNGGVDIVRKGVVVPPHSIYVGLDFIETDDIINSIAQELARSKPVGTGMVDEGVKGGKLVTVEVNHGYGNSLRQTISMWKAQRTGVVIDLTCSYGKYTGSDLETDISNVVAEYIQTVGVGETVYATMIANNLISKLNIGIASIWIQKEGSDTPSDTTVEMLGYEVPFSSVDNIHLTIID